MKCYNKRTIFTLIVLLSSKVIKKRGFFLLTDKKDFISRQYMSEIYSIDINDGIALIFADSVWERFMV
jgi:hypothetical protein